jgi:hypothetical protein
MPPLYAYNRELAFTVPTIFLTIRSDMAPRVAGRPWADNVCIYDDNAQ